MDINELTIGEVRELMALFGCSSTPVQVSPQTPGLDAFAIGKTVLVRTNTAGVWCGVLERKAGAEVILWNARRMWYWKCKKSISLSGVAAFGIDREQSKIAPAVEHVWLEAIEIILLDKEAADSIMGAPCVEAQ